jgi:hypothetical protein
LLLLPFTLLNAAGWAHAPSKTGAGDAASRITRGSIIVLGWLVTATTALWVADLLIDYVGYQWLYRATGGAPIRIAFLPWWHPSLTPSFIQCAGPITGAILALGLLFGAWVLAGRVRGASDEPGGGYPSFDPRSSLADPGFFQRRASWAASSLVHFTIAGLAIVGAAFLGVSAGLASPSPSRTSIDVLVLTFVGAEIAVLSFTGVFVIVRLMRGKPSGAPSWACATLAVVLENAFFAGCLLWVSVHLPTYLTGGSVTPLSLGRELALLEVFFYVAAVWALIVTALVLRRTRLRGIHRTCDEGETIPAEWVNAVRRAQGTARVIRRIDAVLVALAIGAVAIWVGVGLWRIDASWSDPPWRWAVESPRPQAIAYRATAWFLPAAFVFVLIRVRKAARDNKLRRFIGQAWDVLAFWPRRFHPFAVRPYSHIAVPHLRSEIARLRDQHGSVVVSAHSQGAVIAFASLLPERDLVNVGLATYGSPVGTLYRRGFPAYFNVGTVRRLRQQVGTPEWQNFHRLTDPIGGPVFDDGDPADHCLPDPAEESRAPVRATPPLEQPREPGSDLAIHSYYLNELELQDVVDWLRYRVSGI